MARNFLSPIDSKYSFRAGKLNSRMFFFCDITAKVRKAGSSYKGASGMEVLKRGNSFILRGKGVSRKEAKEAKSATRGNTDNTAKTDENGSAYA